MAQRFFAIDSGGSARLARRFFVVDSGGTSRLVKRAFIVDSGGTARLFFSGSATYSGNLTVGFDGVGSYGFNTFIVYGSMSPSTDSNGNSFLELDYSGNTVLQISISSDPGSGSFGTLTVNGHAQLASSASYSFTLGQAAWTWTGDVFSLNGTSGSVFAVTMS